MKILAADTGTAFGALALCEDALCLIQATHHLERAHAEKLLTLTDVLLASEGVGLHDVELLAIATGPGSFTGLRIGVSTWKGLALGANKPLIGVPSLDAMARIHPREDITVCPILDARMDEVYAAAYQWRDGVRHCICEPIVCPIEMFLAEHPGPLLVYGEGVDAYRSTIEAMRDDCEILDGVEPSGAAVAAEARALYQGGDPGDAGKVAPVYLRKSQAERLRERVV